MKIFNQNFTVFLTEKDLKELKDGKIIYLDDGEYTHIVVLVKDIKNACECN